MYFTKCTNLKGTNNNILINRFYLVSCSERLFDVTTKTIWHTGKIQNVGEKNNVKHINVEKCHLIFYEVTLQSADTT